MQKFMLGAGLAALIAIPALAFAHGDDHEAKGPQTRAEVEAKVKERFTEIDANHDSVITRDEADTYKARHLGEMRDKMFAMLDANKDGQISRAEFDAHHDGAGAMGEHHGKAMGGHRMGMMGKGDLFARADINKDGKVTLSEATTRPLEMFDRADTNHDGTVTPEERKAAWENWSEKRHSKGG